MLLQAAAQTPPDISFEARAQIREVRIERRGQASLQVRGGQGSEVRVDKPQANGGSRLRNVNVAVSAEARIADPNQNSPGEETSQPD